MKVHKRDVPRNKERQLMFVVEAGRGAYLFALCGYVAWHDQHKYVTRDDSKVTCSNCLRIMAADKRKGS